MRMSSSTPHANLLPKLNTAISDKMIKMLCKLLVFIGIFLTIFFIIFSEHPLARCPSSSFQILAGLSSKSNWVSPSQSTPNDHVPTNITHLVFGVAASINIWQNRRSYVESWWRPNVTRGLVYFEREPSQFLPWPSTSPPYSIYRDISMYQRYNKHGAENAIRMFRIIQQTFEKLHDDGIRWFVMADDDTVFFLDNLIKALGKYDHTKYFYIGCNSESTLSNTGMSYEMAFGGAGYALSYPLAQALSKNMDLCIKRYPYVFGSDALLQACVADLGVPLTPEKGFHQIDLRGDLSGFLSAHPQTPLISVHHLDSVEPIFPFMTRAQALNHLMEADKVDETRLLQQSFCYKRGSNWSISTAWGYSVQLYENFFFPSHLMRPLETFTPWRIPHKERYMMNTRLLPRNPCEAPHVFFFDSASKVAGKDEVVMSYTRKLPFPDCPLSSAVNITKILVFSPATRIGGMGSRRDCCDIEDSAEKNITNIRLRSCLKDEIIGLDRIS